MNQDRDKLIYQLKILRTLVIGSYGQVINVGSGVRNLWQTTDIARLSNLTHKMKTRGDSVKVLVQTVDDGAVSGPAVIALSESVLNYPFLIKAVVSELIGDERINEYADICYPQIRQFNAELAGNVLAGNATLTADANRLITVLRLLAPPDVALYYSVVAACNFAKGIKVDTSGLARIVRELKFPAEYQQAGLSILNYFSAILDDKYPGIPVEVSIQQHQDRVKLVITLPDGSQDVVEKLLTEYGLVVAGKISPQEFIPDQLRALALQQKLELAQMEVRQTRDLLRLQEQYSSARIASLEQDVKNLYSLLGQEVTSRDELQRGFVQLSLQSKSDQLHQQLGILLERLGDAIESRDEQHARVLLEDIREADPDVFSKVSMYLYDAATTGVIGCYAFDWIKVILNGFPK